VLPVKRHPALQDFSRDHHFFLLQVRQVRWHMRGDRRAPPFEKVLEEFLALWRQDGQLHLREEEEILLPLYRQHPSAEQERHMYRFLDDHEWLRQHVVMLEAHEDQPLLERVAERLYAHVRFEERILFQHLQNVLPEHLLQDLHERSIQFRVEVRPGAIGPRSGG
jgi:iron-sulfur cluster repair protein YtfE (RIC family)